MAGEEGGITTLHWTGAGGKSCIIDRCIDTSGYVGS